MNRLSLRRFTLVVLFSVIGCAWILNVLYTLKQPIWCPRDEIAHFDYIDRLSEGSLPDPRDDVSDYTVLLSSQHFTWLQPEGFDGSVSSMGIAGKSYEAEQPPLYYALLALPHRLLKIHLPPPSGVRILRLLSLSLVAIANALVLIAAARLAALDLSLATPVYLAALAQSITGINAFVSLGNDSLSALCGGLILLLLVRSIEAPGKYVYPLALGVTVSLSILLVKLTNVILISTPLVLSVAALRRMTPHESRRSITATLAPLASVPLYFVYRIHFRSDGLGSFAASEYFASWVEGISSTPLFLRRLLVEAVNLDHIGADVPNAVLIAIALALLLSIADFLLTATTWSNRSITLVGSALGLTLATFAAAAVFNRWLPGVHWFGFRHYAAAFPFLVIAVHAPLRRLPSHLSTLALLGYSLATALLLFHFGNSLWPSRD